MTLEESSAKCPKILSRSALVSCLLFLALEVSLFLFVDRPVALKAHALDQTHRALIDFFRAVTDLGLGKWYAWPSGIAMILGGLALWKAPLGQETRARLETLTAKVGFFFVATSGAGLLNNLIKYLCGRARPKLLFEQDIFGFSPFTQGFAWNSFPSGHTATVFAAAAALAILFPKGRWAFFAFAALIGLSRIMVTAHYPSDVLGGAAIALVFTGVCEILLQRIMKRT